MRRVRISLVVATILLIGQSGCASLQNAFLYHPCPLPSEPGPTSNKAQEVVLRAAGDLSIVPGGIPATWPRARCFSVMATEAIWQIGVGLPNPLGGGSINRSSCSITPAMGEAAARRTNAVVTRPALRPLIGLCTCRNTGRSRYRDLW